MIPNVSAILESQKLLIDNAPTKELWKQRRNTHKWNVIWRLVIILSFYHLSAIYGLYLMFFQAKFLTIVWVVLFGITTILGTSAGAHRLWSHRAYKAKWPMRLILMILQTTAYQNSIHRWVRDHRVHHKFSDTDADPHNPKRGFFFAHIGWLLVYKHPEVIKKRATIDFSDIEQDSIVMFQKRWYKYLFLIFGFILPTLIPYWYWGETLWCACYVNIFRCAMILHIVLSINSVAHRWGTKPYDKSNTSTNSLPLALTTLGESWHNYHHAFPWDYRSDEFGSSSINITTAFIDFFATLGMAYDLKAASPDMVKRCIARNSEKVCQQK